MSLPWITSYSLVLITAYRTSHLELEHLVGRRYWDVYGVVLLVDSRVCSIALSKWAE